MAFLANLKDNNTREWFTDNKKEFEQNRDAYIELISQLTREIEVFDKDIIGVDPKKSMYRIYRDIRFSKDKTPYKTHFGAYICRGGRTSGNPGYYVHLEPQGKSIIGAGLYHPMPDILAKIRQEIDYNGDQLVHIIETPSFKKRFELYQEDKLKRKPKGYEDDNPHIELLKLKSFLASQTLTDKEVLKANYKDSVISGFQEMNPFVTFLNQGMS
jgi:uncharacterized protein (TIGR02453 family)